MHARGGDRCAICPLNNKPLSKDKELRVSDEALVILANASVKGLREDALEEVAPGGDETRREELQELSHTVAARMGVTLGSAGRKLTAVEGGFATCRDLVAKLACDHFAPALDLPYSKPEIGDNDWA